jgi:hypothetical protein
MIDTAIEMPKKLPFLTDDDILELFSRSGEPKQTVSVRLTTEARRILDKERERLGGVNRAEALELLLREIREMRKRGGRG